MPAGIVVVEFDVGDDLPEHALGRAEVQPEDLLDERAGQPRLGPEAVKSWARPRIHAAEASSLAVVPCRRR